MKIWTNDQAAASALSNTFLSFSCWCVSPKTEKSLTVIFLNQREEKAVWLLWQLWKWDSLILSSHNISVSKTFKLLKQNLIWVENRIWGSSITRSVNCNCKLTYFTTFFPICKNIQMTLFFASKISICILPVKTHLGIIQHSNIDLKSIEKEFVWVGEVWKDDENIRIWRMWSNPAKMKNEDIWFPKLQILSGEDAVLGNHIIG